jgi:hypothetical protein
MYFKMTLVTHNSLFLVSSTRGSFPPRLTSKTALSVIVSFLCHHPFFVFSDGDIKKSY